MLVAIGALTHTVTVKLVGRGNGSVRDDTGAISCPVTCSHTYAPGTQVTLRARAAKRSRFSGWSGGGCSGAGACQLKVDAGTMLTARFGKTRRRARLRIRHVRSKVVQSGCVGEAAPIPGLLNSPCAKLRIAIRGTITKRARGVVSVKVKAYMHGRRHRRRVTATWRARIVHGRWHARLGFPRIDRRLKASIYINARFKGSPGVYRGHARWRGRESRRRQRRGRRPASARRVVVFYRQEGGIGGPQPSLVVFPARRARVTLGRCTTKFELHPKAWRQLRAVLRHTHLHALAGNYPAPNGSADVISYVIRAGRDTVRIAPAPHQENEEVMRDLEPLLKVLSNTVLAGER